MDNELRERHVEPGGQAQQSRPGDVALAALHSADVVAVQPGALAEFLLAKVAFGAQLAHGRER